MNLDFLNVLGDKEDHYKGEKSALKDDRTDIKFDAGDYLRYFGASLLGRGDEFSKQAVLEGAAAQRNEELNNLYRKTVREIKQADALRGKERGKGDLKITSGMDVNDFDDAIQSELDVSRAVIEAAGRDENVNLQGVNSVGEVINRLNQSADAAKDEVGGIRYLEQQRLADKREADRRYYADRADARAAQNRNYQLQIMQLQQADKLKAQERKDRMFMTLMAGLQNLGQGFTI